MIARTSSLVIVVAILGFTGWYVYHSTKIANQVYYSAANLKQTIEFTKKSPATAPVTYANGTPVPADSQAKAKADGYYCPSWDSQPGRVTPDNCSPLDVPVK